MFTKTLLTTGLVAAGFLANAQTTAIPDPAFEKALIDLAIDADGIVNGSLLTTNALAVTNLTITSPQVNNETQYITDLTGLEAFVNLENLTVNGTMAETLNVSALIALKNLNCADNMLTSLDVSNNSLLESLYISGGGDVYPMNEISSIDLSNNPNINQLTATGISTINLRNGNNNSNMRIIISYLGEIPGEPGGYTCIEVDDALAAANNQPPYSEWIISHINRTYSLVESCLAATKAVKEKTIIVYPNPVSETLHIAQQDNSSIDKVALYDISGRNVREFTNISAAGVSVSGLAKGTYMLKISNGNETQSRKIIIE